jgi:hypothetical protein
LAGLSFGHRRCVREARWTEGEQVKPWLMHSVAHKHQNTEAQQSARTRTWGCGEDAWVRV